jgi:taurine dioxygenase
MTAATLDFDVRPVIDGFVARVEGVDVAAVDDALFEALYRVFLDYPVLVFPGQKLDARQFYAFTDRFGAVVQHVLREYHHESVPGVSYITNVHADGSLDVKGYKRSREWHTDRSYDQRTGKTTALYALEIPAVGGHTDFADMYRACAALPADLRQALEGRIGVYRWHGRHAHSAIPLTAEQQAETPGAEHPILRRHPESGREALYVDPGNQVSILGMAPEQGEAVLQRLFQHCEQPAFQYSHPWHVGELVIWDNRCTMHRAAGGYPPEQRRVLMRTQTLAR